MGVTLSPADQERYDRMVSLLHSLNYGLTTAFVRAPARRVQILNKLSDCTVKLLYEFGCGDLCPDKERGCASCPEPPPPQN
jgi:hypothetical protein